MLRPGITHLLHPPRRDGLEPRPALPGADGHPAQCHRPRSGGAQRQGAGRLRWERGRPASTTSRALWSGRARPCRSCAASSASPPDAYRTDDRLKEVHYGHWEGQLQDELRTSDPRRLRRARPRRLGLASHAAARATRRCRSASPAGSGRWPATRWWSPTAASCGRCAGWCWTSRPREVPSCRCRRTRYWWSAGRARWL